MTLTSAEVRERLEALADPRILEVNQKHGDDHAVNLTKLRAVAKEAGRDAGLARELWATGDTASRLVALLVSRPKDFSEDELDAMLREARVPKVQDWLVSYIVMKGPHADALRERWFDDADPVVAAAAWDLTTQRVKKSDQNIDRDALLDQIDAEIVEAPERLQWAMNFAMGEIGINSPEHRSRVLEMGERLGVLRDYPTSPGCVSPFVPLWVPEMVRRAEGA
ncbi:DNA alkylation repair protein [Leucobacter denitrificans]|uniref:DNA alkylation repair protein n=1 Tax=Leucobacter denitrificans TaxID=683042 RepID=A0A7G9S6J3_9MICO|nr:DNA alkylation repair protein [Leucobacter denitrificans]QNN63468.1 DNA alkylation repair protein [Leucobacter denitrificans]